MEHTLKLYKKYFDLLKAGNKTVEIRLAEPKRDKISIDDTIVFFELPNKDKSIRTQVLDIHRFPELSDLLEFYTPKDIGFQNMSREEVMNSGFIYEIYPKEKIKKYGLIAFKLQLK